MSSSREESESTYQIEYLDLLRVVGEVVVVGCCEQYLFGLLTQAHDVR